MLLASLESHHPEDLSEPLSFVATVLSRSTLGLNGSIIIASACYRLRADCLHRLSPEGIKMRSLMWLAGFADSRRNVKNALCYFVFKEHRGNRKAPSLSMPKSKGGERIYFLIFQIFFEFCNNTMFAVIYRFLRNTCFI